MKMALIFFTLVTLIVSCGNDSSSGGSGSGDTETLNIMAKPKANCGGDTCL